MSLLQPANCSCSSRKRAGFASDRSVFSPGSPHEILLILDATTGQNALAQAQLFNDALDVTGIALTKLDGTAKGGIAVSICSTLEIPLNYIGIGEKIEDLEEFDPIEFVNALF